MRLLVFVQCVVCLHDIRIWYQISWVTGPHTWRRYSNDFSKKIQLHHVYMDRRGLYTGVLKHRFDTLQRFEPQSLYNIKNLVYLWTDVVDRYFERQVKSLIRWKSVLYCDYCRLPILGTLVHDVGKQWKWHVNPHSVFRSIYPAKLIQPTSIKICCGGPSILVVDLKCVKPLLLMWVGMCLNKLQSRPVGQLKQLLQKPFVPSFCTRSGPKHTVDSTCFCSRGQKTQRRYSWRERNVTAVTLYACHPLGPGLMLARYYCYRVLLEESVMWTTQQSYWHRLWGCMRRRRDRER